MKIKVWDWHGKFTGNFQIKAWPPIEDPYDPRYTPPDWEWIIFDVNTVFNRYRSYEVVAPYYSDDRGGIMADEWQDEISHDLDQAERQKAESEGVPQSTPTIGSLEALLESQPDGTPLVNILAAAQKLDSNIKNTNALGRRAQQFGFEIEQTSRGYCLYKAVLV